MENLFENQHKSIPVTEATGRDNSARNAIKHGACAVGTLILDCESYDDFLALEKRIFAGYNVRPDSPNANPGEVDLIREAVRTNWFYLRAERNYAEVEARMLNEVPNQLMWGEDHHNTLARYLRYRTANANLLAKARKAVDDFRKSRIREVADMGKYQREDQKLAMSKERLKVYREKNKPFDIEEELEFMREKAVRLGFRKPDPEPPAR